MIRKAVESDIPSLVELGVEAASINAYESLIVSRHKIQQLAEECTRSINNFAWVSEKDGVLLGALCAIVLPLAIYERNQAQVVIWYCKHPGDGLRLMRQFLAWTKTRPMIKQVIYEMERNGDPRIAKAVMRAGFNESLPSFVITR